MRRVLGLGLALALAATACSSGRLQINDMLQTTNCYIWSMDENPIQIRVAHDMAYDSRSKSDEPLATWLGPTVQTFGFKSIPLATFTAAKKDKPASLSMAPLMGADADVFTLNGQSALNGAGIPGSEERFDFHPICKPDEVFLGVAVAAYLAELRKGGTYIPPR
ncbi:MAG TPA: hypothetical protein VL588_07610 [Bdellovibrionota bacterium]|nr:hypothetical protein [Bdellovibrionota bacterium]